MTVKRRFMAGPGHNPIYVESYIIDISENYEHIRNWDNVARPCPAVRTEKQKYDSMTLTMAEKENIINQPSETFKELRNKRIEAILQKYKIWDEQKSYINEKELQQIAFAINYFPFELKPQYTEEEIEEMTTIVKTALRETLLSKQIVPQNDQEKQPEQKNITDFFFGE